MLQCAWLSCLAPCEVIKDISDRYEPNAWRQLLPEAGAHRTLEAVGYTPGVRLKLYRLPPAFGVALRAECC
jgi:hypothetical protein